MKLPRSLPLVVLALASLAATKAPAPPVAKKSPQVSTVNGQERVDDYYWLREKSSPEVRAYLQAEKSYTDAVMAPTQGLQKKLYQELLSRVKETDLTVPYMKRGYYYYSRVEKGLQYPIYARRKGTLEAPEEAFLDLNVLAKGKSFIGLGGYAVTDDGQMLAYSTDLTGFREYNLHTEDLQSGTAGVENIAKVSSFAWAADGKTLFYVVDDDAKRPFRLYRHRLGAAGTDELVYEEKDGMFDLHVSRTRSLAFVVLASDSRTTSEIRVIPADRPAEAPRVVAARVANRQYELDHRGDLFYIRENGDGRRNFRVVTAPVADPRPENWKELVPHDPAVFIDGFDVFQGHYVLTLFRSGLPQLRVVDLTGAGGKAREIAFPEATYALFPEANPELETTKFRFQYGSFITPRSVYDYDVATGEKTLLKETEVPNYDRSRYQTERIAAKAKDGTEIPISLVYKKGLRRDGRAPLLLYAYGSYGIPMFADFSSNKFSLLDRGVVYAMAHIRGGGELGKKWHDDGRMLNKKNTFTDFIAAAEHLVGQKYTSSDRLVVMGGSAGGLLIGVVINMRPDLFKAALALVPFVDVINTMLDETLPLTINEFEEWGNPKKKDEFDYMLTYSPYDNVARKAYPSLLVESSLNDSQVMYWEPAKWVAKLRAYKTDKNPLLFNIRLVEAGHGGASGRYDRLREEAFRQAFVLWQVGIRS